MHIYTYFGSIYAYLCTWPKILPNCILVPAAVIKALRGYPPGAWKTLKWPKFDKNKYGVSDQILKYFKPVFNKEYRNINTHSDAVPELPPGTVAGSALCAFRY